MHNDRVSLPDSPLVSGLVRDSKAVLWVLVVSFLMPLYLIRLVQWYIIRYCYPDMITPRISDDFHSALIKLWFAVLVWPIILICHNLPRIIKLWHY